jgi:hypothetical protein
VRTPARVLAVVAVAASVATGCSSAADRTRQELRAVDQAAPTSVATASRTSTTTESATSLDPDSAFQLGPEPIWREHPGAGPAPYENRDPAMRAGSYRLMVRCLGGSVGVDINGRRASDVECATSAPSIAICLRHPGLTVSAEWIRGPFTDLVWQLVPQPAKGCAARRS